MKKYTSVIKKRFDDDEETGRTLSDAEFAEACGKRDDVFRARKDTRLWWGIIAISLVMTAAAGGYLSTRTVVEIATDFFESLPQERAVRLTSEYYGVTGEMKAEEPVNGLRPASRNRGSQGGGDPRSRVVPQNVLGMVSGQVKGKTVASSDVFSSGGFATDIDAILAGTGGLQAGGDGGLGRGSAATIGYGAGYGSGFGGSGSAHTLRSPRSHPRSSHYSPPVYSYDSERNEEYSTFVENRFKDALTEPLSTFSLDVDVASYTNVRRMINQGQLPPPDAVRVEQFINYFKYDYPNPTGQHPINVVTETMPSPWNRDFQLVRIGVKAKEIQARDIPASNLVFLIDVSGSMSSHNRLPLVQSSLKMLTDNLRDKDRVAIVTYSDRIAEVLPSTAGSDKRAINRAIDMLYASGGTAGGAGIQMAYEVAQRNFIRGGNNRIILCTDGDFNIGISSPRELENFIEQKRKTGVYLTVLGYGMGNYKDNRLQTLSQKGNGNHAYIDNIQEANRVLVKEFSSTMYAVANDAKVQIEFNPAYVSAYRLVGYESRMLNKEDFNDDAKDAGELGAGHTVTALYEVIPVGVKSPLNNVDGLKYQQTAPRRAARGVRNNEMMTVKVRYKPVGRDNSVLMETPVKVADRNREPSADFTFASAVAMFGQLLRDSEFKGTATYSDVITLASSGLGEDPQGYRREFVRLAEAAKQLAN